MVVAIFCLIAIAIATRFGGPDNKRGYQSLIVPGIMIQNNSCYL